MCLAALPANADGHSLGKIFSLIAEVILQDDREYQVLQKAATWLAGEERPEGWNVGFELKGVWLIRRQVQLHGLIEIARETVSTSSPFEKTTSSDTVNVWRLTDYGRRQLRVMTGE